MKELGVGVIGLGMGKNMLAINQDNTSKMKVRGLCDINEDRLNNVAKKYGISFTTTDYRKLLERDDIDIIGVYSPDHLHAVHVIDSLLAGKHVICTKPMVTTIEDCEKVVKTVDETGLKFLVGQTCRFNTVFMAAKRIYDNGDLGDLIFAEMNYIHDLRSIFKEKLWWLGTPKKNFLLGGGSHAVDLLRWFMGDIDEVHVYAKCGNLVKGYTLEDNFLINLKFKNSGIGRILAVYDLVKPPLPNLTLGLYGTKGSLVDDKLVLDTKEGPKEQKVEIQEETVFGHSEEVVRYMKHFEDCIANDKKPLVDVRDGAKVIATCMAGWESIKTGKPAKVRNKF